MVRGIRPSVPADIPPKMKEVWNIARDCWDQNPQERASFQSVLDKLNDFSRMEDTTPFAVYQPMPMPVNGKQPALRPGMLCRRWNSLEQPKQTTTEWQGLETSGDSSNEAPPKPARPARNQRVRRLPRKMLHCSLPAAVTHLHLQHRLIPPSPLRLHPRRNRQQQSTTRYVTPSLRPSQPRIQCFPDQRSSSRHSQRMSHTVSEASSIVLLP